MCVLAGSRRETLLDVYTLPMSRLLIMSACYSFIKRKKGLPDDEEKDKEGDSSGEEEDKKGDVRGAQSKPPRDMPPSDDSEEEEVSV